MLQGRWRQHVFSKRVRDRTGRRTVDGLHVLTPDIGEKYRFTDSVLRRRNAATARQISFIFDCGDELYVGVDGRVPDVLGEGDPYAYEEALIKKGDYRKNRAITFVHGFFAPRRSTIPDLAELYRLQAQQLRQILRRANEGEEPVAAAPVDFLSPRSDERTDWNRLASEFERGMHARKGAMFKDGTLLGWLEVSAPIPAQVAQNTPRTQRAPAAQAKPEGRSSPAREPARQRSLLSLFIDWIVALLTRR